MAGSVAREKFICILEWIELTWMDGTRLRQEQRRRDSDGHVFSPLFWEKRFVLSVDVDSFFRSFRNLVRDRVTLGSFCFLAVPMDLMKTSSFMWMEAEDNLMQNCYITVCWNSECDGIRNFNRCLEHRLKISSEVTAVKTATFVADFRW